MIIHKTFCYRMYPTNLAISRLDQWNFALKCLWNIANEQRILGVGRLNGYKIYPTLVDQQKELTSLREEHEFMAEVPRHVAGNLLSNLDVAWQRCFNKIASRPNWKKKSDYLSFTETQSNKFRIRNNKLKFPKLPPIPIVMPRPLEGKAKTCTIKRDGDQWFVHIVCEIKIEDPIPRTEPKVGIDRGVRNLIVDSEGRLVANPKFLDKSLKKLSRAQRAVSRKVKGSNNREKAKNEVSKVHRKIRRQRGHILHRESTYYAKSHGVVVLENLIIDNMLNNRLARHINDTGWGKLGDLIKYKLTWSGGTLFKVPAHYTSQTCSVCNHVDKASRFRDRFKCTKCGHEDHADLNAAKVILARWSPTCQPVEASSQRTRRRIRKSRLPKSELWTD